MSTLPPLGLTDGEHAELQRRVRAHTTPQRDVTRARMILLAADALPNRQIARLVGMHPDAVGRWRRRFQHQRVAGLADRPRSGRPLVYGHDDRLRIVALRIVATVTREPPNPASHWSHTQLADTLADIGISASQIGRILADLDIKPHRVRGWITRREVPGFWERTADVCGLYLNAPDSALVLAVDEKTGIGARSRTQPSTLPAPGRPARQEHEYVATTTNEIARFQPLLDGVDLTGIVVTADALHTQREHADWLVTAKHAAYVLIVKANQPTLHHQLSTLPWRKVPVADHTRDRGHGRVELRRLQVITVAGLDFPHAAQAIRITHRVRSLHRRRWRTVSVYAVTSLAAAQASPARLRPEATGSPRPGGSGCRARPSGPGRTPPRGDHRLLHPHHLQRPDQSDAYKYAAYDGLQRLQARSSP